MILSVLIPTIPERVDKFTRLYNELMAQKHMIESIHPSLPTIEVLVNADKRFLDGGISIGKKREDLVYKAEGEYVCFVDDDDFISPCYVESLVRCCLSGLDVITFRALVKMKDFWALVDMNNTYNTNDQITPEHTARRPPWHHCPVKSKYAKMYPFNDKNNAEDYEWMEKVLSHCTTGYHTDRILYEYHHGEHSEADKIPL